MKRSRCRSSMCQSASIPDAVMLYAVLLIGARGRDHFGWKPAKITCSVST